MKPFMDKDFLLNTKTAQTLFHEAAEKCPIIDYRPLPGFPPRGHEHGQHHENARHFHHAGKHS